MITPSSGRCSSRRSVRADPEERSVGEPAGHGRPYCGDFCGDLPAGRSRDGAARCGLTPYPAGR